MTEVPVKIEPLDDQSKPNATNVECVDTLVEALNDKEGENVKAHTVNPVDDPIKSGLSNDPSNFSDSDVECLGTLEDEIIEISDDSTS